MTTSSLDCDVVTERLIGGERTAGDPALAEHVGSCLRCFRTASDLRGLPQLRAELARSERELPDPGAAFWANFPAKVTAAWESTRLPTETAMTEAKPPARGIAEAWQRARSWLRLPVPAALAGAVCAASLVVLVTRQIERPQTAVTRPVAGSAEGAASAAAGPSNLAGSTAIDEADDSVRDLGVAGLWALRAGLEQSLTEDVGGRAPVETEGQAEASPTALSDELDELDTTGLAVLSRDLGRGRI